MELNEFIKAGFNVGLYAILLYIFFFIAKYGIGIIKSWSVYVNYKAVGQKLKVKKELEEIGIAKEDIEEEIKNMSGIISKHLSNRKVEE